jgi:hypothetical protein
MVRSVTRKQAVLNQAYLATVLTFLPLFWAGLLGFGGVGRGKTSGRLGDISVRVG